MVLRMGWGKGLANLFLVARVRAWASRALMVEGGGAPMGRVFLRVLELGRGNDCADCGPEVVEWKMLWALWGFLLRPVRMVELAARAVTKRGGG